MKKIDYRHIIFIAITLGFLALAVFVFPTGINRILEGCRDFGFSMAFYVMEIFEFEHNITPTVNTLPAVYSEPFLKIAESFEQFQVDWVLYWQRWATSENFQAYMEYLGDLLYHFSKILLIVLPFFLLLYMALQMYLNKQNNDTDVDSVQLKAWKRVEKVVYIPVKRWVQDFIAFSNEHGIYKKLWLWIWAYNFNVIAIVLEFFAFYFYFIVSYDFAGIYTQFYKLLIDLSPAIVFIPIWVWCVVGVLVFDYIRKNIGYKVLNYNENRNRTFIDERPIIFMVNGTMGKKKTTAITDMALSQEVMFRDKAHEKMFENDMKFPNFPWLSLINDLKRGIEYHQVYNLATTSEFVKKKQARWKKCPCREKIFGYNYKRYGLTYDDKLKIIDIWETIENYARLFFVYFVKSSLIISNYSIRTDNVMEDLGNFPLWNTDFFQRDSRDVQDSQHSNIMDFDMFRLGKKMIEDNPYLNTFEFGVEIVTELGKERGNMVELVDKKKKDETTNQKNDGYNNDIKMKRHSGTVDNFPFVRVIGDEQRPESLGADLRQLCDLVHITDSGKPQLAMPFFILGEICYDWIIGKFCDLYYQYSHVRGDNTLIMYLLKNFCACVEHYYKRIYNRFGYCTLKVAVENGSQDGNLKECKYFLMNKKIYSNRFSTDCYSDFFHERALHSDVGINDLPKYADTKATFDELKQQNSYFVNDLVEGFNKINHN